jgi:ketosteroid isomerase-like protein
MSRRNLELVRRGYLAFRAGGPRALEPFFDDEIVWHTPEGVPEAGVYRGREAVVAYLESLVEVFETLEVEPQEFADVDDHVVVVVGYRARGEGSGVALEWAEAVVWTLRAGRVIEFTAHPSKEEALRYLA